MFAYTGHTTREVGNTTPDILHQIVSTAKELVEISQYLPIITIIIDYNNMMGRLDHCKNQQTNL